MGAALLGLAGTLALAWISRLIPAWGVLAVGLAGWGILHRWGPRLDPEVTLPLLVISGVALLLAAARAAGAALAALFWAVALTVLLGSFSTPQLRGIWEPHLTELAFTAAGTQEGVEDTVKRADAAGRAMGQDRCLSDGREEAMHFTGTPRGAGLEDVFAGSRSNQCWRISPAGDSISIRVHRGLTLSALAVHFRTSVSVARQACGLRNDVLRAGQSCHFPLTNLHPVLHVVQPGETLSHLVLLYRLPNRFTVRVWNCLSSNRIRAGDRLLVLVAPVAGEVRE